MSNQSETLKSLCATINLLGPVTICSRLIQCFNSFICYQRNDIAKYDFPDHQLTCLKPPVTFLGPHQTYLELLMACLRPHATSLRLMVNSLRPCLSSPRHPLTFLRLQVTCELREVTWGLWEVTWGYSLAVYSKISRYGRVRYHSIPRYGTVRYHSILP